MGDCRDMSGGYPSCSHGPTRRMPAKKPIFNVCLRVILPVTIWMVLMSMLATFWLTWKMCNEVSWIDKKISDSGELDVPIVLQSEEEGYYYEVFKILNSSEYIAFRVQKEHLNEIQYMEVPGAFNTTYWRGEYQVMDLSQSNLVYNSYYLSDEYVSHLTRVKVYDFSAYKGYTIPMFSRGPGFFLFFLWFYELFFAGIVALPVLIIGLIIFVINKGRRFS